MNGYAYHYPYLLETYITYEKYITALNDYSYLSASHRSCVERPVPVVRPPSGSYWQSSGQTRLETLWPVDMGGTGNTCCPIDIEHSLEKNEECGY